MNLRSITLCGLVAAMLSGTSAFADSLFSFSFGTPTSGLYGSGTFDASPTSTPGVFLITGISGTTDGTAISALLAPGSFPDAGVFGSTTYFPNDNELFVSGSGAISFDVEGVSYEVGSTGPDALKVNLFNTDSELFGTSFSGPDTTTQTAAITGAEIPSAVPEPQSLALFGTGLLGVVGLVRRRFAK